MSFVLVGCDDSNNNSGNTFTEDQFADDITLRANPETDTVVKFLEPPIPIPVVNTRDTGGTGIDEIRLSYKNTLEHTWCWEDDDVDAAHSMVLEDIEGTPVLNLVANGNCVIATVPPGDYTLKSSHDGLRETTHVIFVIPNPEQLQQAINQDGFINKLIRTASRVLDYVTDKTVEDAVAQTSPLETLISTRKCIGCDLRGVDLSFRDLQGVDLSGAKLRNPTLQGSNVSGAQLKLANLINANLTNAILTNTDFSAAKMDDTTILTGAKFGNANCVPILCTFSFL